jgi:hypothetical protein
MLLTVIARDRSFILHTVISLYFRSYPVKHKLTKTCHVDVLVSMYICIQTKAPWHMRYPLHITQVRAAINQGLRWELNPEPLALQAHDGFNKRPGPCVRHAPHSIEVHLQFSAKGCSGN